MNKGKIAIIVFSVLGLLGAYYFSYWSGDVLATIWIGGEKEFSKPIDVVWRGQIISTMAGGSCVGLKGAFDKYDLAMACFLSIASNDLWNFEGVVTVTGKWLGITCAYKDTIFGECVPEVVVENIEK